MYNPEAELIIGRRAGLAEDQDVTVQLANGNVLAGRLTIDGTALQLAADGTVWTIPVVNVIAIGTEQPDARYGAGDHPGVRRSATA